jgi:wyosine [tRNA(Phe)-imidazoG37] synthetase (radical SAM superfamily)
MECKFLNHGLALAYQETVKPCCTWQFDNEYKTRNQLHKVDLVTWHKNSDIQQAKKLLSENIWPENCSLCEDQEKQNRFDSMRLNGANAYEFFDADDITLEIRPGSVCNFACQTCWPAASSRVAEYYKQANMQLEKRHLLTSVDIDNKFNFSSFEFLQPIAHRIKSVVLLGGEPFYDKNCLAFLEWWNKNTNAELFVFTNGSAVKFDLLESIKNKLTLVFSLDATEKNAEYIRFGTNWDQVYTNFKKTQEFKNFEIRVNITQSVYNYIYLDKLLEMLMTNWPSVVTFGVPGESHLTESVIPQQYRKEIINKLNIVVEKLKNSSIEQHQKSNAVNAISSTINNLIQTEFNETNWKKFKDFVSKMDKVKGIDIRDYCPEVAQYLN